MRRYHSGGGRSVFLSLTLVDLETRLDTLEPRWLQRCLRTGGRHVPLDSLDLVLLDPLERRQNPLVLGPLIIEKHPSFVCLVLDLVHQVRALRLLLLAESLLLGLNLLRIEEVALLLLLIGIYEAHCDLLFEEPLVSPLQIVYLIGLVLSVDHFSEHYLQAVKQTLRVAPIDAEARLQLDLSCRWSELAVALCLDEVLYQSLTQSLEYWVVLQLWASQRLLFELETPQLLGICTYLIEVAVLVVEIWVYLCVLLASLRSIFSLQTKQNIHLRVLFEIQSIRRSALDNYLHLDSAS